MKNLLLILTLTLISTLSFAQQIKVPLPADRTVKVTATLKQQTYTAGDSVQITNTKDIAWLIVNPPALKATLKVKLPTRPYDNQSVYISFGGTMLTGTVVTTLTVAKTGTQVILQPAAPTTAVAGTQIGYRWKASNAKWYRIF